MKEEEKIQNLLEIAWANGFPLLKDGDWKATNWGWQQGEYDSYQSCDVESIIFDHRFIKALCMSKYGNDREGYSFYSIETPTSSSPLSWIDFYLFQTAISDNRIEYLWSVFGGQIALKSIS